MRPIRTRPLLLVLPLLAFLLVPTGSEARGGLFITGEDIFECGPLPEGLPPPDEPGWKSGYRCSVFGAVDAYIAWWGCTPVAYRTAPDGTLQYDNSAEVVKAVGDKYPPQSMKVTGWKANGRWVILAVLVAYGAYRWYGASARVAPPPRPAPARRR